MNEKERKGMIAVLNHIDEYIDSLQESVAYLRDRYELYEKK